MKPILHWSACAGSAGCDNEREEGRVSFPTESDRLCSGQVLWQEGDKFRLSTLGPVLQELGELFNFFGFLDHAHGEQLGGRGFLEFFAKFAGKLVKPLHPFAKFLSSIPPSGLDGNRTDRRAVAMKQVVAERILCEPRMRSEAFGYPMCRLRKKLFCGLNQSNSQEPGGSCWSPKRHPEQER